MPELGINILSINKLKSTAIFSLNTVSIYKDKKYTIKGYKDTLYITKTNILYPILPNQYILGNECQDKVTNKPNNSIYQTDRDQSSIKQDIIN
jgi:hypothetical protein